MGDQWRRVLKLSLAALFASTWLLMLRHVVNDALAAAFAFGPRDVARRVMSPDRSKTAVLVRSYASLDLSFALYIVEDNPREAAHDRFGEGELMWVSHDFEPTTLRNWHEEVEWSVDSQVVAVSMDGGWVFAYDFAEQGFEESALIQRLLESHGAPRHATTGTSERVVLPMGKPMAIRKHACGPRRQTGPCLSGSRGGHHS